MSCYPTFGGSGVVASELGMALAERGHEVHFLAYDIPGRLNVYRPGIYYHEVTVPDYPLFEYPPYSIALASRMVEIARQEKLDLIHAHYAIPHAASALLARDILDGELRVVTTLHGTDVTLVGQDRSFLPVTKYAIEKSDSVTAVSQFLKNEVCVTFTCDKEVDVIYNFIDPRIYSYIDGSRLKPMFAPNNEKLLVHVSNYRKVKRPMDVMEVFLRLREKMRVKLILVGQGPELPSLEKIAKEQGAFKDLILLGNRETVAEIIAASDLMLLPSELESFGLVALEAMASGTPPITSDAGGLPEVIIDGVTGCMVKIGDVDAMVDAAYYLLTHPAALEKMQANARKHALENFSLDKKVTEYENHYLKTVKPAVRKSLYCAG